MRAITLLILVLCLKGAIALSEGEKTAISDLLLSIPDLGHLSPPWVSNASEACGIRPFKGILCSEGLDQHVVSIKIALESSGGSVPNTIEGLQWMKHFSFIVETLEAPLPASFGNLTNLELLLIRSENPWYFDLGPIVKRLVNLVTLDLSYPGGTGELPIEISNFANFSSLSLSEHPFDGPLPSWVCNMDNLTSLLLASPVMIGFDSCAGKLRNLQILKIRKMTDFLGFDTIVAGRSKLVELELLGSSIYGDLDFTDQQNLVWLTLGNVFTTGSLPPSLFANRNLKYIVVGTTLNDGPIPSDIANLTSLQHLMLRTHLTGTIPPEIGLCQSLRHLDISFSLISGSIPTEIGNLRHLELLDFGYTRLSGTLPDSLSLLKSATYINLASIFGLYGPLPDDILKLPNLVTFTAPKCNFSGSIPASSPTLKTLNLASNSFSGAIPPSILQFATSITLSNNNLSGAISDVLFAPDAHIIDLSQNKLEGSLPDMSRVTASVVLDLSFNRLTGTIPDHYANVNFSYTNFGYNNLHGPIDPVIGLESLTSLDFRSNNFYGSIPSSVGSQLRTLLLSNNNMSGSLPKFPPSLQVFIAPHNLFSGSLEALLETGSSLKVLDLSHNELSGVLPDGGAAPNASYVSLAFNHLSGTVPPNLLSQVNLKSLDLSHNAFTGMFPFGHFGGGPLSTLLLSDNKFSGTFMKLDTLFELTVLDISNNQIGVDASVFVQHLNLAYLSASNNSIRGTVSLQEMTALRSADFSNNKLEKVDFKKIRLLTLAGTLNSLSISNNHQIAYQNDLQKLIEENAISVTSLTEPSPTHPGVICSRLTIGENPTTVFNYDESLFSFDQCRCDRDHYGKPPKDCFLCTSLGSSPSNCSGYDLSVNPNYFLFPGPTSASPLEIENCISADYRVVGLSNCIGLRLQWSPNGIVAMDWQTGLPLGDIEPKITVPSASQMALQCRVGSSGRLCSKCSCDYSSSNKVCYFSGPGQVCEKCRKVFEPKIYIPISILVILTIIIILSIIFYFILASKRSLKDTKWEQLSIGKRILYRFIDLTAYGQITVMVTFVQILVEVTHWDAYALRSWVRVVNGESEGLGLRCFYPFLSNPSYLLICRLLLPFIVIGLVSASIGCAEVLHKVAKIVKQRRQIHEGEDDSEDSSLLVGDNAPEKAHFIPSETRGVHYPALALASSTSISIIKFFYFGTTLSAFEYLFFSVQKGTNKKFVQAVPWMEFGEAHLLRMISIPFIAVFLVGLPVSYIVMCWRLRHKIGSPFIRLYFGSLFENFQLSLFWWELVNIFKKVTVSLFLRGLSSTDSRQPILTSFVIAVLGIVIMRLKPWKLDNENVFEGVGAILLIFSLASNRLGDLTHSRDVIIGILVLDICYVISCLSVIVWRLVRDETTYQKEWKIRFESTTQNDKFEQYDSPLLSSFEEMSP